MNVERTLLVRLACALLLAAASPTPAIAQDTECVKCHAALTQKKVIHAPMHSGCATCHAGLDGSVLPHKPKAGSAGKSATACVRCHENKMFDGKGTHAPVAAGLCKVCHDPHSSDHPGLLTKAPLALCLDCHPEVAKEPHVVAGFSRSGHPLGEERKGKVPDDPLRPGKKFYCVSCHEPHRSDLPRLVRFPNRMDACQKCHNK